MSRWLLLAPALAWPALALPVLEVTRDDTPVTRSCRVVIPPGTVIADANTNGVLHVAADGITITFAPGTELRGAPDGTPWDALRGIGIRVEGRRRVTLKGARVHGFFNGVVATRADGLRIEGGDFSDNYRQRLRSTPQAEDGADWLFPHHNDAVKWRDQYGGAICVEESAGLTIRNVRVRRGQNGILLDRVNDSRVYDNDCSFLSGWGLALWRSSRNVISRNAFDFCVRGHVEGVYNRGQDSAGILCFEQCNDNVFAENSATHGGDGFFGFAGREALGELWLERERERLRRETGRQDVDGLIRVPPEVARNFSARGCNRNVLLGNDFSYAPAHGIEMTFSEGNVFARNRLVENAICGVWGGYSSDTLIAENLIEGNGGMAYGLERGGINMEHAAGNRILGNTFRNNKCAVHLWWDHDAALLLTPGVAGGYRGVSGNVIAGNTFVVDATHPFGNLRPGERLIVLQLRDDGTNNVRDNVYAANKVRLGLTNAVEFAVKPGAEPRRDGVTPRYQLPIVKVLGKTRPVGARSHLRGRDKIVMDEWGPWDHESPLVRAVAAPAGELAWEVFGVRDFRAELRRGAVTVTCEPAQADRSELLRVRAAPGVTPFELRLSGAGFARQLRGTLVAATWDVVFFPWEPEVDPRNDLADWRRLAAGADAVTTTAGALDFNYGWRGPKDLGLGGAVAERGPGGDHFGMIARTSLALPAGKWRFRALSDDGVRVTVAGRPVIENWTWHGPTRDEGVFEQAGAGGVEVVVEHFEIDGYAVLRLDLEPAE
jgi:parallel beta-helix repeat protein